MTTSSSLVSTYPLFKVMTVLTYVFCWKCMWSSLYYADFIWSVPFLVRWCPIVHCNTYEVNGSLQSQNPIFHHQNDPYALSTLSCSQQQCTVSCGVKPKRCINWPKTAAQGWGDRFFFFSPGDFVLDTPPPRWGASWCVSLVHISEGCASRLVLHATSTLASFL